jgi:hypothetical protein
MLSCLDRDDLSLFIIHSNHARVKQFTFAGQVQFVFQPQKPRGANGY